MIPTTLGIALVVFSLYHTLPGDPAIVMMGIGSGGEMGSDSDIEARIDKFRRQNGLDRALPVQFFNYIGPFNLKRDGHPWFSSPYTERKTETRVLEDGTTVIEGEPMPIAHLPTVSDEDRARYDSAAARLVDVEGQAGWAEAREELVGGGGDALPSIFSQLSQLSTATGSRSATLERLFGTLQESTGAQPAADGARGVLGEMESWCGWFYAGIGRRVQNTGARPWGGLLALDLGEEMQRKEPVLDELGRRLKVTVPLSLAAVILSYIMAIPLGIFSVRRQGTRVDAFTTVGLFVLYSIPQFWAGLMLIIFFGKMGLDILPVLGLTDIDHAQLSPWGQVKDYVLHIILPIATMTYGSLAYLSRQMRAGMLDVIRQDYIRTARAKGLSDDVVVYKHALRNSVIPVITLFASILPILIGGSIIVEKIFDLPGMGKYAFEGLLRRDFYIVMATTIFTGIMTQLGILLSDITYSLVDPRIRYD